MMFRKHCFTMIAISCLFFFSTVSSTHALEAEHQGPRGVFFAPHMEAGTASPDFLYQREKWPRLVQMMTIADKNDAKVTLLFNPQWADYLLKDQQKYDTVKQWQRHGHEVGLHYHMVTHVDWCGYTNRTDSVYVDSLYYQGTVIDMMALMNRLAAPERIVTACIGPDIATEVYPFCWDGVDHLGCRAHVAPGLIDEIDFPDDIIYDIDGIRDGRTRPIGFEFNGAVRFHLRHGVARSKSETEDRLEEISSANPDDIIGLVTHASDYDPRLLNEIFQYLRQRKIRVQTVSDIMKNDVQPPHEE